MGQPPEVLVERRGPVLVARLNRPDKRNAINRALADQLMAVVEAVDADPELRVGVLASSAPGMFCAGADLAAMAAGELTNPDGSAFRSFTKIEHRKPWIAAVTGPVLGGGLEMALACEMIVSGEGATFGLPEARRGILAAGGGAFRLPRAIPRAIATEMVLTGRPIDAARAYQLGLVNLVVEDAAVLDAALELAEATCASGPLSVAESLAIVRVASELSEEALWPMGREALGRLLGSNDGREGMAAFLGKRAPVWSGR